MAELKRVRLEEDLQQYLETQAERILGKTPETLTAMDYSTLVNRALYEHKLAQASQAMPLGGVAEWLMRMGSAFMPTIPHPSGTHGGVAQVAEDYSLDYQLGELFEQEAA